MAGLTQEELAEELAAAMGKPFSQATISRLELDQRVMSVPLLKALTEVLGLPADWFLYGPQAVREPDLAMRPLLKRDTQPDSEIIEEAA